jgi:hypothetical protein
MRKPVKTGQSEKSDQYGKRNVSISQKKSIFGRNVSSPGVNYKK